MEVAFWFWIATLFATQYVNADRFISAPTRRRSNHHGATNRNRTVSETLVNSIGTGTYLANSIICDLFSCVDVRVSLGTPPRPVALLIDTGSGFKSLLRRFAKTPQMTVKAPAALTTMCQAHHINSSTMTLPLVMTTVLVPLGIMSSKQSMLGVLFRLVVLLTVPRCTNHCIIFSAINSYTKSVKLRHDS
jgi:hypothetical protein